MDALQLQLQLTTDADGDVFEALVDANHRWLGRYARLHPSFGVEPSLLERNSLWMNAFFQKSRMVTSPASAQAKALIKKHRETVVERLRSTPVPHSESPFSTCTVDPMAALMYAASVDRCPHDNLENLLAEAWELLQCAPIRAHAIRSGFARCIYRFLTEFTETQKRIPCLRLLVVLAQEDRAAVVDACKVAAQGQFWEPNMFVLSLQKRHHDNPELRDLAVKVTDYFSKQMPIKSPIDFKRQVFHRESSLQKLSPVRSPDRGVELPELATTHRSESPYRPLFSPTTTMSTLYQETASPYSPSTRLPLARPPTCPVEQSQRAKIFSIPKLAAVEGQHQSRCCTPNASASRVQRNCSLDSTAQLNRHLDPLFDSPPQSPNGNSPMKARVTPSEKYSWNPECINSVSGFEWWWRSLPQNHASLEPTQKLKMVTKAAVRLHSKGELQRAIELYLLALSSEIDDEVEFRLRINLACAYETAEALTLSVAEFRRALALKADDPYALYKLGGVLTTSGAFDEAGVCFKSIIGIYPPAIGGLKNLEKTKEKAEQEEAARRSAVATAKVRLSPLKVLSPRIEMMTKVREFPTLLAPEMKSPTSHKMEQPVVKKKIAFLGPDLGSKCEPSGAYTLTKNSALTERSEPDLLDVLVRRCQEACINIMDVLKKLDPQQRGLVHKESFITLVHIMTSGADHTLNISPNDWVLKGTQIYLRYGGFLSEYIAKYQPEATLLSPDEIMDISVRIDGLIRNDVASLSSRKVSEWVRLGRQRAVTQGTAKCTDKDDSVTEIDPDDSIESDTKRTQNAFELREGVLPRTRMKKDKTREDWILTAEKARVLARRQHHCIKSLHGIAGRARAHILSRRKAMTFISEVVQKAKEELQARKLCCVSSSQDVAAYIEGNLIQNHGSSRIALSEITFDAEGGLKLKFVESCIRAAMTRLRGHSELKDLKTIAARFGNFCQVPPYFTELETHAIDTGNALS